MNNANAAEGRGSTLSRNLVAQLVSGYSEECTLYHMLFGLTSRQRRCLGDGGDLSEFVELIDEKDAVLNQIAKVERNLEPVRARWMAAPFEERERVAGKLNPLLDEVITSIQRTVELERDNERLLETRRRELSQVLADARRWRCSGPDPIPAHTAAPAPPEPGPPRPAPLMA
ncbi:MAG: hypothetical protein R6V58_04700 [Planctomycetota bacterium]